MPPTDGRNQRGLLWSRLREAGYEPNKAYREHSVEEMHQILDRLEAAKTIQAPADHTYEAYPLAGSGQGQVGSLGAQLLADFDPIGFEEGVEQNNIETVRATTPQAQAPRDRRPDPVLRPQVKEPPVPDGLPEGAIRADEAGRIWYREEIGPNIAGRKRLRKRVTQVVPENVEVKQIHNGEYIETVEVVGEGTRSLDAFVTMPTTQVGIFKDPRFPFKVFTYNGSLGFSYGDVNDYYGGLEFVPSTVKKKFVGNMLAYDMKSVISEIERKAREIQLARSTPMFRR